MPKLHYFDSDNPTRDVTRHARRCAVIDFNAGVAKKDYDAALAKGRKNRQEELLVARWSLRLYDLFVCQYLNEMQKLLQKGPPK